MMEQQPDRDPTPWLSLMEGSSTSTTMPMMPRDMLLRSSMMALLPFLLSLSDTALLDMVWLDKCSEVTTNCQSFNERRSNTILF